MSNITISLEDEVVQLPFPVQNNKGSIERLTYGIANSSTHYQAVSLNVADVIHGYLLERNVIKRAESRTIVNTNVPSFIAVPMELPKDRFTGFGIIVLGYNNGTRMWKAASCAIDSWWGTGVSIIESEGFDNILPHDFTHNRVRNVVTTELPTMRRQEFSLRQDLSLHTWMRTLKIHVDWYEILSPVIEDPALFGVGSNMSSTGRSTLERLLEVITHPPTGVMSPKESVTIGEFIHTKNMEHLISIFFADGLSRCGAYINRQASGLLGDVWEGNKWQVKSENLARSLVHKGQLRETFQKPSMLAGFNSTTMTLRVTFNGYVLAAQDGFDFFCIVILLSRAFMALAYTIWVVWRREITEAWDTIPELIALCQTSPPPNSRLLSNTCAGIRSMRTMSHIAIVEKLSSREDSDSGAEELRLRIIDSVSDRESDSRPVAEVRYGVVTG